MKATLYMRQIDYRDVGIRMLNEEKGTRFGLGNLLRIGPRFDS